MTDEDSGRVANDDALSPGRLIQACRRAAGLSQEELAARVGVSRVAISQWERGETAPRPNHARALAAVFDRPAADFVGGLAPPPGADRPIPPAEARALEAPPPPREAMRKDLPVMGTAAGSAGAGAFQFEGGVIDYVRRPTTLAGAKEAYAIYVVGDSMAPEHSDGDLRVVHPHRPCRPGDTVIVLVKDGDDAEQQAYIKTLVRRTATAIRCRQHAAPHDIAFPADKVVALHRVLTVAELLGF